MPIVVRAVSPVVEGGWSVTWQHDTPQDDDGRGEAMSRTLRPAGDVVWAQPCRSHPDAPNVP